MPVTELEYTSVFELLTAVLLSAQATDVGVNKATRRLFPVANTPAKILALGLDGLGKLHQNNRPVPQQSQTPAANLPNAGGAAQQRRPQRPRSLRSPARRGSKNGECGAELGFWRGDDGGGHPYFPHGQPHGASAGQNAVRSGTETAETHPARIFGRRPPLADFAWPLCVHGAQPAVRGLPSGEILRV